MTIFDLLFIFVFFATVITLASAAVAAIRGRRKRAVGILRGFGIFAAVYLGIVVLVAIASPRRVLSVGEDRCWDDWCMAVVSFDRTPAGSVVSYTITLRVSSRARRVYQSERGVSVYVLDDRGRRYDPLPDPATVPISVRLGPQESVTTTRAFRLPADARSPGLVVAHGAFPGIFIIGDHRTTIVPLD